MKYILLSLIILASGAMPAAAKKRNISFAHRFDDSLQQTADSEARLDQWFKDAKFGAFIHFGVYSMLEGEYKGRGSKHRYSEWIQVSAKMTSTLR